MPPGVVRPTSWSVPFDCRVRIRSCRIGEGGKRQMFGAAAARRDECARLARIGGVRVKQRQRRPFLRGTEERVVSGKRGGPLFDDARVRALHHLRVIECRIPGKDDPTVAKFDHNAWVPGGETGRNQMKTSPQARVQKSVPSAAGARPSAPSAEGGHSAGLGRASRARSAGGWTAPVRRSFQDGQNGCGSGHRDRFPPACARLRPPSMPDRGPAWRSPP